MGANIGITKNQRYTYFRHRGRFAANRSISGFLAVRQLLERTFPKQQKEGRHAVIFVDLDNFNFINLLAGHQTGDQILKLATTRFASCLPPEAKIIHVGGDQYLIVLPDINTENSVIELATALLSSAQEAYSFEEQSFLITCSIGIAFTPSHELDVHSLLKNAGIALHKAKETKNTFHFYNAELEQAIQSKVGLERSLQQAIRNDEFLLYYQPQINSVTGDVYGAEALVRWISDGKVVPPADFIPHAEETGFIVELGFWVFREACLQAKAWHEKGLRDLKISVNLSARQFQDPHFLEKIIEALAETGANPRWIGLEITESVLMQDMHLAITTLRELRRIGFEISVDDFGTGYSSLGYLRNFPIDRIKIDKTFVQNIEREEDKVITKAIIAVGKALGIKVLAEGVETEEHVQILNEVQCDELQGYFFKRPIPSDEFETFLREFAPKFAHKKEGLSVR